VDSSSVEAEGQKPISDLSEAHAPGGSRTHAGILGGQEVWEILGQTEEAFYGAAQGTGQAQCDIGGGDGSAGFDGGVTLAGDSRHFSEASLRPAAAFPMPLEVPKEGRGHDSSVKLT
jgi:hypothetical protein